MAADLSPLDDFLDNAPPAGRLLVAFSGGLDSHVLLHALRAALARRGDDRPLQAVHVHHGLQPQADDWILHCEAVCAALSVPLAVSRVTVAEADVAGQGLEAAAREARYRALADAMQPRDLLLIAHHQDDQAETLLLQLLRGAGPAGLAAMPRLAPFGPGWLGRPLLDLPRRALEAHARDAGLAWVEDPSNADPRFDRNYLRQEILPRLAGRWPGASARLAAAAANQADALAQLDALARDDAERCRGEAPGTLSVQALRRLRRGRCRNLLRLWLRDKGLAAPTRGRMDAILDAALTAGPDRTPCVTWAEVEVRRYRDELHALPALPAPPREPIPWDLRRPLTIPALGLSLDPAFLAAAGITPGTCPGPVTVRFRRGGERIRLPGRAHSSALKTLMQAAGMPPWERERLPLVYVGEVLVAAGTRWIADPAACRHGA